jgi:hypothetical protein
MAFQVGSACYGTAGEALQAIAATQAGSVVVHGSAAYVVDATVSGTSITYTLSPVAGGSALTYASTIQPQPCGLLDWQDGLVLGWGVAGAWLLVAAVMVLRKGVHE